MYSPGFPGVPTPKFFETTNRGVTIHSRGSEKRLGQFTRVAITSSDDTIVIMLYVVLLNFPF